MELTIQALSDSDSPDTDEFWETRIDSRYEVYLRESLIAIFGIETGEKIGDYIIEEYVRYYAGGMSSYPFGKSTTIDGVTITVPTALGNSIGSRVLYFLFTFE